MKRLLLIINPGAGRGAVSGSLFELVNLFTSSGYRVELHPTQREGDATDFLLEYGERFDRVVCCGGDGTVNEVVGGIVRLQKRPELGIIPTGTTNDFSYTIGMPTQVLKAAEVINSAKALPCDTGLFNSRPFIYVAAFGLFTTVTFSTPQQSKQIFGIAAYLFEGIKNIQEMNSVHIKMEHDSGSFEGEYLLCMVSNTVSVAGFRHLFRDVAELDDGEFEITLVRKPASMADLQKILNLLLSMESVDNNFEFLTVLRSSRVVITSEKGVPWTVDGQNAGIHSEVVIEVVPQNLDIIREINIEGKAGKEEDENGTW